MSTKKLRQSQNYLRAISTAQLRLNSKKNYFPQENYMIICKGDVLFCLHELKTVKAVGWDYIPGMIADLLKNMISGVA
jgi:hypothetical protein